MESIHTEMYDRAAELFSAGRYTEAESLFDTMIHSDRAYADVHNKMGYIQHAKGDLAGAAEHFGRAVGMNPSYSEAAINLAVTLNDLGRHQEAERMLENSTAQGKNLSSRLDPFASKKLANEHFRLGCLYLDLDMSAEAVEEFSKAERLGPGMADVMLKHGIALGNLGRHDEAIDLFSRAIETNPRFGQAWGRLGLAYYTQGLVGTAIQVWEEALLRHPGMEEPRTYLRMLRRGED